MHFERTQLMAVLLSILMVTSFISAPVTAAPSTTAPPTTEPTTTTDTGIETHSSLHARSLALQQLADSDNNRLQQDAETLEETLSFYYNESRAASPPFDIDRQIAARAQSSNPDVTDRLLESDSKLATTAVTDAQRVFDARAANASFDTQAVQEDLQTASNALSKGHDLREKGSIGAFNHYERAWYHAQRALDRMDAAITPSVEITTRQDPVHNESITYVVRGTVSDVRNHDLSNVTLVVNGDAQTVPLQKSTTPDGTSIFVTEVTLSQQVTNITAIVTDPGATYATRSSPAVTSSGQTSGNATGQNSGQGNGNGNGQEPSGSGTEISASPQTGSDTLWLDGDGLPDVYERTTTKTDPTNPNSNSSRTSTNESTNDRLDGAEDFDDDGVITAVEYQHGLDPFDNDTDGDGLTDRFELDYADLNGTLTDTDGDGVSDAAEDFDNDGLPNHLEQAYGTHPHQNDTDGDSLIDSYETNTTGTSPTAVDSNSSRTTQNESANGIPDNAEDFDNDTLSTGTEQEIGTDPFDTDTDDDRLTDAFEYAYEPLNPIAADSNDDGIPDDEWDIDGDTLSNYHEQQLGTDPTDVDTDDDSLQDNYEVNVTETSPIRADSNSTRTTRNESDNGIDDGAEDFDRDGLNTSVEADISTDPFDPDTDGDRLTDVFEYRWGLDPLERDSDDDNTTDDLEDPDSDGLNHYWEQRYGTHPFVNDTDDDDLGDGVEVNTTETSPVRPDSDSQRTEANESNNGIIDGNEDFDGDGLGTAAELEVGTEPFDPDTDGDMLTDGFEAQYANMSPLTNDTDGDGTLDAMEDPDGDGLTNLEEQAYGTDPNDPDTDGDGLTDGFEVTESKTDPTKVDSDSAATPANESEDGIWDNETDLSGDTLTNFEEQSLGTDPLVNDTDGDGLADGYEVTVVGTDPVSNDSNSSMTATNESGNGVVDGREDYDGDGLIAMHEAALGTSPFASDTDGDGLPDSYEATRSALDPTKADTNGDGTSDGEMDFDGDNLTTTQEARYNTSHTVADTDGDGLTDGREVLELGTDPLSADTDGDGLLDGQEVALGTDPLNPDSDADGTPDGNETYTVSETDAETNVSVSASGDGNVVDSVSIDGRPSYHNTTDARNGPVVRVETTDEIENGTVSLPITSTSPSMSDASGNASALSVYRFDSASGMWQPVSTTIDVENGTAVTTLNGSGYYTVFNESAWVEATSIEMNSTSITEQSYSCSGECTESKGVLEVGPSSAGTTDSEESSGSGGVTILCVPGPDGDCDSDNDGIPNSDDPCPFDPTNSCNEETTSPPPTTTPTTPPPTTTSNPTPTESSTTGSWPGGPNPTTTTNDDGGGSSSDSDGDGVADSSDNCPETPNAGQGDIDGDGVGDACDGDMDGDGVPNDQDNCVETPNEKQQDRDNDGVGAACDSDEPVYGSVSFDLDVPADVDRAEVYLRYRATGEQTGMAPVIVRIKGDGPGVYRQELSSTNGGFRDVKIPLTAFMGESVTVTISATGDAGLRVSSTELLRDTDGDGLYDRFEGREFVFPGLGGGTVETDVASSDTDGDRLSDGEEVTFEVGCPNNCRPTAGQRWLQPDSVTSNPTVRDTDGDGRSDYQEVEQTPENEIQYAETQGGDRLRWDPDGSGSFHATSDPMQVDTDGDGLTDAEELELHTDPRAVVTYEITHAQETAVLESLRALDRGAQRRYAKVLNVPCRGASFCADSTGTFELQSLTDASADFDFVRPDAPGSAGFEEQVTFLALDGSNRTDTWMRNELELEVGTDPWDPDSDDDGLTDGQEFFHVTGEDSIGRSGIDFVAQTDPMDPDTDGDGYWDGWIGVYGVNKSENVILYREHLQSGGVSGAQAVPVQQDLHNVGNGQDAAARSADIDDDGVQEHSTIHVGELHWGTNPLDTSEKPDPSITLEVGFLSQTSYQVWSTNNGNIQSQWLEEIKENYALYDIEVTFSSKEVIEPNEMPIIQGGISPWNPGGPRRATSPLSEREVVRTIMEHKSISDGQTPYLLVADEPDFQYRNSTNIGGWNMYYAGGALREMLGTIGPAVGQAQGMVVFQGQFNSPQESRSTAMHEIAHSFQIGEADDSCSRAGQLSGGEIYSGESPLDNTPETIGSDDWSIMTNGPANQINGLYYAFSIEELFSIEDALEGDWPCGDIS